MSPRGKTLTHTASESCVAMTLATERRSPVSRDLLIRALTRDAYDFDPHRLERMIHRLRHKGLANTGGRGSVSLYVKAGGAPSKDGRDTDFSSAKPAISQAVVIAKPQATTYYVRALAGQDGFTDLSVLADYVP